MEETTFGRPAQPVKALNMVTLVTALALILVVAVAIWVPDMAPTNGQPVEVGDSTANVEP